MLDIINLTYFGTQQNMQATGLPRADNLHPNQTSNLQQKRDASSLAVASSDGTGTRQPPASATLRNILQESSNQT